MESKIMGAVFAFIAYAAMSLAQVASTLDFWSIVDRYGFPTGALVVVVAFLWTRQRIADKERNGLITKNNELTEKLIEAVKLGNACKFIGGK